MNELDTSEATRVVETLRDLTNPQQVTAVFYLVGALAELVPLGRLTRCVEAARRHALNPTEEP